ncbi:unnamed protein product [Prorocentrum cordatum]|uniref:Calpain catalytic domain-containing protein n=1 Tax=Prorocentrum cordatum TaxID=2364126 RepID=A0ABN9UWP0_9DINO|nr:unnamed protein product [Polarella glacialis]
MPRAAGFHVGRGKALLRPTRAKAVAMLYSLATPDRERIRRAHLLVDGAAAWASCAGAPAAAARGDVDAGTLAGEPPEDLLSLTGDGGAAQGPAAGWAGQLAKRVRFSVASTDGSASDQQGARLCQRPTMPGALDLGVEFVAKVDTCSARTLTVGQPPWGNVIIKVMVASATIASLPKVETVGVTLVDVIVAGAMTGAIRTGPGNRISDANIKWLAASLNHNITFNDKTFNGVARTLTDNGKVTGQNMTAFIESHSPAGSRDGRPASERNSWSPLEVPKSQDADVWEAGDESRVVQAASATASAVLAAAGLAEGGGARGRPPPPAAAGSPAALGGLRAALGADAELARVASPAAEPATRAADPAGQDWRAAAGPLRARRPGARVEQQPAEVDRGDGFVREVSIEDQEAHGCLIPEGSVRVVFGGDTSSKWVLAAQLDQFLRKAPDAAARVPSTATLAATSHHLPPAAKWPAPVPAAAAEGSPQGPPAAEAPISPARPESVLAELRSVELSCKLAGESFVDHEFPALVCGRVTRWCRPREIGHHDGQPLDAKGWSPLRASKPGWKLFRGAPQADDVRQGELGDCWFLSSLAALAEFEEGRFVRALLPEQTELSPAGAYVVHLCLGGRWRSVLVDDRLPCIGGQGFYTQLAYCATGRLQLWASLIEKGFAKACGSYEAVRGGQANQALSVLTGWPCTTINFDRHGFDPEVLWATLCSSKAAGFLMTCSTGSGEAQGMVPNHVHSLMDVADARDTNGRLVHLLKIRNPHGKTKWRGPWSPGSPEWTPELRRALGCSGDAGSGVFFMALDDFLHLFVQCTICRIHSEWCEVREELTLPGGSQVPCAALELEVFETTECAVSLVQLEERLRGGPLWQGDVEPLACIGFVLLSMGGADAPVAVAAANLRCRAAASAECWLKPGMTYLMAPRARGRRSEISSSLGSV